MTSTASSNLPGVVQADGNFRRTADDIGKLKVRNASGEMVPIGTLVNIKDSFGPDRVMHYNAYPSADITGGPAPGVSSGQAEAAMAKLAAETLPKGMKFEWTELTYQKILARKQRGAHLPALLFFSSSSCSLRSTKASASHSRSF
jgi:multidrug efflux pump subunit AcrB